MIAPEARSNEILDYEKLVEDYNASLFATLRHHRSSEALEIWVPDDDPGKSILNMIEAAELAGVAELHIRVGPQTLARLNIGALEDAANRHGDFAFERDGDRAVIAITQIGGSHEKPETVERKPAWFDAVHPVYRQAICAIAGRIAHEGELDLPHGTTRYEAASEGVTLAIAVGRGHTITAAAHAGTTLRTDRAVMDALCSLLPGLSVQEASDHGAQRLERMLRANGERPVAGIVLPENADPVFVGPARLMREIAAEYVRATGYAPGQNNFTSRPSPSWLALSRDEKLRSVQAALDGAADDAGLAPGDARVVEIEQHLRATVAFAEHVEVGRKPHALMDLEQSLRRDLEPTLQLFSLELKDANRLRRLKELA